MTSFVKPALNGRQTKGCTFEPRHCDPPCFGMYVGAPYPPTRHMGALCTYVSPCRCICNVFHHLGTWVETRRKSESSQVYSTTATCLRKEFELCQQLKLIRHLTFIRLAERMSCFQRFVLKEHSLPFRQSGSRYELFVIHQG